MNENDKIASRILSAKIGTLRQGTRFANGLRWIFDEAADDIRNSPTRSRSRITALSKVAGKQIEKDIEEFAERRLSALVKEIRKASGEDIKAPSSPGTLKMFRSDTSKFLQRAATQAKTDVPSKIKAKVPANVALNRMQAHARNITKTAANAAHNAAVLAIARRNKNVFEGVMANATLDDRTTKDICVPRHGAAWDLRTKQPLHWSPLQIPFPGRPPWHFGCRTTLTPVLRDREPPTDQVRDFARWSRTADARQAIGIERLRLFRRGLITQSQLVTQP